MTWQHGHAYALASDETSKVSNKIDNENMSLRRLIDIILAPGDFPAAFFEDRS
jgi:hypothetical protein